MIKVMDLCTKRGANHKELLSKSCTVGTKVMDLFSQTHYRYDATTKTTP